MTNTEIGDFLLKFMHELAPVLASIGTLTSAILVYKSSRKRKFALLKPAETVATSPQLNRRISAGERRFDLVFLATLFLYVAVMAFLPAAPTKQDIAICTFLLLQFTKIVTSWGWDGEPR